MKLAGRVAVVTGGSKGVGKGVALGLAEAGATVYVTGRDQARLVETVAEIDDLGGRGHIARCEHADDAQVDGVFRRVRAEQGRLDVLVNNAMSTPQRSELPPGMPSQWDLHPFWEIPVRFWDSFNTVGLRSHYVASAFAAPLMIDGGGGLIVCISAPGATRYVGNVAYGVGKAGIEKLVSDMAEELRPYNVASISLWPGFIRTEDVLSMRDVYDDLNGSYSQIFPGRPVAALAADANVIARTGTRVLGRELAAEHCFDDQYG